MNVITYHDVINEKYIKMDFVVLHSRTKKCIMNLENVILYYDASSVGT